MLLERGELDGNMNKSFGSGSLKALGSPLRRLTIAKKALATSCSVVCGDVNVTKLENIVIFKQFPESQFIYKTIDVDTSSHDGDVSDASLLQGVANVVINFVHDDLTAMWAPGYVSPERAEATAIKKNGDYVAAAAADSRQDVFVIRLVIYQLFAKHSYFGPEMIKEDRCLDILVDANFVADLSEISDSGAKKVLCQMFQKDPAQRISLKDILEHKVFHSLSSSSSSGSSRLQLATQSHMDEFKNSQDLSMDDNQLPLRVGRRQQAQALDSVGRKVNESLELSVSVHKRISQVQKVVDSSERNLDDPKKFLKKLKEPLIRYADTLIKLIKTTDLTIIFVKQLSVRQLSMLKQMDEKFAALEKNIGNVCQLMNNLQEAGVPDFCFVMPYWLVFATNFRQHMKSKTGWKEYYKLYVCDEGPLLMPEECSASDEPEHAGITIKLPGWLMLEGAPLLYVVSKLLQMALAGGMEIVLIPFCILYFEPPSGGMFKSEHGWQAFKSSGKMFRVYANDTGELVIFCCCSCRERVWTSFSMDFYLPFVTPHLLCVTLHVSPLRVTGH